LKKEGVGAAITQYQHLKSDEAETYDFGERELNNLGYQLLQENKLDEAIEIFILNVKNFPKAFNTYDSLGEAYMKKGNKNLARKNYKKSLELNPKNQNALEKLKELE